MPKLDRFEILVNEGEVLPAGSVLRGTVTVALNEAMSMRQIRLQFYGGAHVRWSERHSTGSGKNRRTVTRHYSATETFFDQTVVLSSQESLGPGTFNFPFEFHIPPHVPASFETFHGHVRYSVKANIDKPWKFDHVAKKAFTVVQQYDLNRLPMVKEEVHNMATKMLCCLCCKSGPINSTLNLRKTGYVPGEYIHITGECQNFSDRLMDKSYAVLIQYTTLHATTKTRTWPREVMKFARGPIPPGGQDTWNEMLQIPPLPASELAGCSIIDIKYVLELHVDPSGPSFDLVSAVPIVMGTIPLNETWQEYGYNYVPQAVDPQPQTSDMPMLPPADLPAPPSYNQCAFGGVNIKDENDTEFTRGEMEYAPQYAYYNFPALTPPGV